MKAIRLHHIILFCLSILVALLTADLFLKEPPIWPDEAIYADIASNLIRENRLGADLWEEAIPGIKDHALWNPPVYFYTLAFWLKVFGLSIVNQRLLSLFFASAFISMFYFFAKQFFQNQSVLFPRLATLALLADFFFLRAAKVSRPEILVLLLGVFSLYLLMRVLGKLGHLPSLLIFVSGASSSLAFLSHPVGILFPLGGIFYQVIKKGKEVLKTPHFYLWILAFSLPVMIWLILIFPDRDLLLRQLALATERKKQEPGLWTLVPQQPLNYQLLFWLYLLTSFIFWLLSFFKRERKYLLLGLLLGLSWVVYILGNMRWYYVLPLPFVYLALLIMISEVKRKPVFIFLATFFILVIFLNLGLHFDTISTQGGERYSYNRYVGEILKIVPDKKTVFLSAIPDPYFGFKESSRSNRLYQFPALQISQEDYLKLLDSADYIVYTGSYDQVIHGRFLFNYIEKNYQDIKVIGKPSQYQAFVVELKPKDQRVNPLPSL